MSRWNRGESGTCSNAGCFCLVTNLITKRAGGWLTLAVMLVVGWDSAAGQERTPAIRVDTDLVTVDIQVSDREGGRAVARLGRENFAVYEDGVKQRIDSFVATDAPLNVVLLIDTSGSTREEMGLTRRAAQRFLNELRPQDRLALVQFNREVELVRGLTADRGRLESGLSQLTAGTGTAFYDALHLSLDEVLSGVTGRRAIVALTDGVDSFGQLVYDRILTELEQSGTTLFFLELETEEFTAAGMRRDCRFPDHFEFSLKQLRKYYDEYVRKGPLSDYVSHCRLGEMERLEINRRLYESARREMRKMAGQTGGNVFPVKDTGRLDEVYARIAADLRTVYSISYYPSNERHDGRWRTLRVTIDQPGLTARARPGYRSGSH